MKEKKTKSNYIHLILGTHWDREWLYPFEYTQSMLIEMMDSLLDFMESNPEYKYFHLDGQVIMVEDYLRIRPENRKRLTSFIKKGRILIGPYYSLLEENHILGESVIRNLFIGNKLACEYGSRMNVGYSPTGYGRISQLPQIFKSVNIDNIIFYRGLQQNRSNFEFLWEGPDKSQILGMRLSGPTGRGTYLCNLIAPVFFPKGINVEELMIVQNDLLNIQSLERGFMDIIGIHGKTTTVDNKFLLDNFTKIEKSLAADTTSNSLLLIHAQDYGYARNFFLETINAINEEAGYEKLKISSLQKFLEEFRNSLSNKNITVLSGELKQSRKDVKDFPLYMSTISSIGNVKIINRKAELAVARYAEVWESISNIIAGNGVKNLLENTWKELLASHAHDSIAGQGTDEVIDNVYNRLVRVKQTADGITERSMKTLVNYIKMPDADHGTSFLTVFNPSTTERNDVLNLNIDMPFNLPDKHGNVYLTELWSENEKDLEHFIDIDKVTLQIKDAFGKNIDFAINKIEKLKPIGIKHSEWGKRRLCSYRFKCSIATNDIPPLGYKVLTIDYIPKKKTENHRNISSANNQLENDFLHIHINQNGTLDVLDKKTRHQNKGLLLFEDSMETGTMTQAKSTNSITFKDVPAELKLIENNHLSATYEISTVLNIPAYALEDRISRSDKTVEIKIYSYVTLKHNSSIIDIFTKVANSAKDHRLRVLFPTNIVTQKVYADQPFDIVERDIKPNTIADEYLEKPYTAVAMQSFVDINDGNIGMAIMTLGLLEYEILQNPTNTTAITLLRCFQGLNKFCGNLDFESKRSQLIGKHEFKYAIHFHQGNVWEGKVHQRSEEHMLPLKAVQSYRKNINGLPPELSFIKFLDNNVSLSALKTSETGDAIVARIYNNSNGEISTSLITWKEIDSAYEVDSLEQIKSTLNPVINSINIKLGAKKIMSIKIKFNKP